MGINGMLKLSNLCTNWQMFRDDVRNDGAWNTVVDTYRLLRTRAGERSEHFDDTFGTDTTRLIRPHSLNEIGPNGEHASEHWPTRKGEFLKMMELVGTIDHQAYTFLDMGCGLGRVVLLATAFPFRRVVGVDFSPDLLEGAKVNLASYSGPMRASQVDLHLADAADFPPPPGNLLVYMFDPFGPEVVAKVVANLVAPDGDPGRRVLILYYSPSHEREVLTMGFTLLAKGKGHWPWHVYQWDDPRPSGAATP